MAETKRPDDVACRPTAGSPPVRAGARTGTHAVAHPPRRAALEGRSTREHSRLADLVALTGRAPDTAMKTMAKQGSRVGVALVRVTAAQEAGTARRRRCLIRSGAGCAPTSGGQW